MYSAYRKRHAARVVFEMEAYRRLSLFALASAALAVSGCVQVEAPDKPIVIELNVNIRQEIVYRLDKRAEQVIEEREDIF